MSSQTSIVQTEFAFHGYGKNYVKLLQVRREGKIHYVKEVEVSTELTLNNTKDYLLGDNSDIVATDSQKNTVYALARQNGISCIEKFALLLSEHFLRKYAHVTKTRVYIEETPWKRIEVEGREHVHAFILSPESMRHCEVHHERDGKLENRFYICDMSKLGTGKPLISAGLKNMRVMKTTQSAFKNFVTDEFRSLPDADDRLFCTVVQARWWFNTSDVNFDKVWEGVKTTILETFAGPAEEGIYSPSVQNTLYLTERSILVKVPQIDKVEMILPNVHYFGYDFGKLSKIDFTGCKNEAVRPTAKPPKHPMKNTEQTSTERDAKGTRNVNAQHRNIKHKGLHINQRDQWATGADLGRPSATGITEGVVILDYVRTCSFTAVSAVVK
ncbi:hypothetical protein FSP39_020044 [Pinctada imbricata]|uniref:Uricase n=1 Tax=Pinctada imbricata TaxID=66713 RepID=A0AA89BZL0_PINIB|nr:hypothetical protein FSP39_020044 [Pinctada imbricata]